MSMTLPPLLAAVDLGSNSFHMVIARLEGGSLQPVATFKDRVRLAAGLDQQGFLTEASQDRALACLRGFAQELHGLPPEAMRAVGTSTLRKAKNALPFLLRAHRALGARIDVITGRQEADLIYRGVRGDPSLRPGRLLVVDIGGGSTELALGEGPRPLVTESVDMGCVSWTGRFFPDARVSAESMDAAVLAAREQLRPQLGEAWAWDQARGSSGTIRAVERVLQRQGWSSGPVTADGLRRLRRHLIRARGVNGLDGLSTSRAQVFAGGVAVLSAVFEELGLDRLLSTDRALREGVLEELLLQHRRQAADPAQGSALVLRSPPSRSIKTSWALRPGPSART